MAYLFDTDALSEPLRPRPLPSYMRWLAGIPREEQFASAVSIGELYKGAFRGRDPDRILRGIASNVLPAVTVLSFDVGAAQVYGRIEAFLSGRGQRLMDADLQIAATAIHHDLEIVTGNLRHFERIPGLKICGALAAARKAGA